MDKNCPLNREEKLLLLEMFDNWLDDTEYEEGEIINPKFQQLRDKLEEMAYASTFAREGE